MPEECEVRMRSEQKTDIFQKSVTKSVEAVLDHVLCEKEIAPI